MRKWCLVLLILYVVALPRPCLAQKVQRQQSTSKAQRTEKTQRAQAGYDLNIALDYFQSGKFHEALMIFSRLDSIYNLNPRIRAYTGLCYYYDNDFSHASRILDEALPSLTAFAPQERSVYYHADAESHFILNQYDAARTAYDSLLVLCPNRDKAEAYYRLGFINIYKKEWLKALDNLQAALVYFREYLPDEKARIAQIRNMIEGCCEKIASTLNSLSKGEGK